MTLEGRNLVAGRASAEGARSFSAVNPASGVELPGRFRCAEGREADSAVEAAAASFHSYRRSAGEDRARLLEAIAQEILALGDELIERCAAETALGAPRLLSERTRTVRQLRMFADLAREGSWVDARIDTAQAERKPTPKPDIRRLLIPLGPVAVFGAGNFPLAFSVAGGDTASALAAGNPVIVKAHPSHPGTCELVGRAVARAVSAVQAPPGVFSLLFDSGTEIGTHLIRHPALEAVGFTGSESGGLALFRAAVERERPIPVYAEMGSTNPVILLPGALEERAVEIAAGLKGSFALGVGQFCTNPGVVFALDGRQLDGFVATVARLAEAEAPATMLSSRIREAFESGAGRFAGVPGLRVAGRSGIPVAAEKNQVQAVVFETDLRTYRENQRLRKELFGPSTLIVRCGSRDELLAAVQSLDGNLAAAVHGTAEDLELHRDVVAALEQKAGRLIFNGFPTGVEVCPSMHHGGPFPATTDVHFTSVGTAAVYRFVRPVCYQSFPDAALPPELQDANPLGIWRTVNGELTRKPL